MIRIHDPELCQQLLGCDEVTEGETKSPPTRDKGKNKVSPRVGSSTDSSSSAGISRSTSQLVRAQDWLSRKARRNIVALPVDPEVQTIQRICDELYQRENHLLQEINVFLTTQTYFNQCKREMLYKKWTEQVFVPLYSSLTTCLDSVHIQNDAQRRELFDQFLKKKDVFLDTIDTNEYDPLKLNSIGNKAKTSMLQDPLIAQQVDYTKEEKVIRDCDHGVSPDPKTTPLGRDDTDPVMWLAMKLVQINSDTRNRSRQRLKGIRNHSHFDPSLNNQEEVGVAAFEEFHVPHKQRINYPRERLSLEWKTS